MKLKNILIIIITTLVAFVFYLSPSMHEATVAAYQNSPSMYKDTVAPYPNSPIISDVDIDWSTHIKKAPGSDNWPLTWAEDNQQYSSWGDGGGFNGSNRKGRVSLGFARIEGDSQSKGTKNPFKGINIFGGFQSQTKSSIDGKSYGILSLENVLYAWVSPGSGARGYKEARLYKSLDHARSWQPLTWNFSKEDRIIFPTFLQFGKNYSNPRDNYVYVYASILQSDANLSVQKPGHIALLRVPVKNITDRKKYEAFTGLNKNDLPEWSTNIAEWQPVFSDPNGVGWNVSASYNPELKRYFLITEHYASFKGHIGIFDSSTPWGPWTTTHYAKLGSLSDISTFYYNFSNKWLSQDGKSFVLVFTGIGKYDAYNSVKGRFVIQE